MINRNIFLHMPKEMLAAILEQLPNPVYAIQDDYTVLYANREPQSILNIHPGMQLREKDGVLTAPGWEQETMLSQETGIQDIYRVSVNGTGYLCFQKYIPEDMDKSIFSVVSVQPEAPEYDLYFDCNQSAVHSSADRRFLSHSPQMEPVLKSCQRCAPSELPILLLGESGSGKTMMAEYIHRLSSRRNGPFLVVNCAAIAKELLESELFGYAPYAFTNASPKEKKGLFELANGGTLLLDEIGDMPLELQSKILTAVESQSILPVGGQEYRPVDVRILAATNKDLASMVEAGTFRDDLYYRLNTFALHIPPLRERPGDIPLLARTILDELGHRLRRPFTLTDDAVECLQAHDWPGNVRELRNALEFSAYLTPSGVISRAALPSDLIRRSEDAGLTLAQRTRNFEKREIRRLLDKNGAGLEGKKKTAAQLGISLASLYNKLNG